MSHFLLVQTLNGLSFAALLFLLSSGLSLIYGVMKIVNIAHGSFFMVGAYVALSVMLKTNNFFLAAVAGGLAVGVLGFTIERGFLRRFPLQALPQMMITLGFALLIRDLSLLIWGGDPYILPCPEYLKGSVNIIGVVFPIYRIFIFFVAAAVAIALWLFNEKTLVGAKLRAAVDDYEMAGGVGLNVPLISGCMFGLGAFLAGFGGAMGGPIFGVYPGLGFRAPFTELRCGYRRRKRQSPGIGGGKHIGRIGGQFRKGPDPGTLLFHIVCPHGTCGRSQTHRALWKRVRK